jgi:hypothetical protein
MKTIDFNMKTIKKRLIVRNINAQQKDFPTPYLLRESSSIYHTNLSMETFGTF